MTCFWQYQYHSTAIQSLPAPHGTEQRTSDWSSRDANLKLSEMQELFELWSKRLRYLCFLMSILSLQREVLRVEVMDAHVTVLSAASKTSSVTAKQAVNALFPATRMTVPQKYTLLFPE